jgi:tryptophan 6-halogenase
LFIDASGFRARLIQQELGEHFVGFGDNLFNDRAVAMPTPRADGPLPAQTRATALSAGWVWNIPLTNRDGNGYVYSSAHLSPDAAEAELRAHLGVGDSDLAARHLEMKVGRVVNSWSRNCLAIGLAQGFIEPLEATALHIVQATVEGFIAAYDEGEHSDRHAARFNVTIGARYDGIRDYIVCHYRANQRSDTDYWRANAANSALSESLKAIITCWFTGGDLVREIYEQNIARYYAPLSWHCLLGGYGIYPDASKMRPPEPGLTIANMADIDAFIDGCTLNFSDHAAQVRRLAA